SRNGQKEREQFSQSISTQDSDLVASQPAAEPILESGNTLSAHETSDPVAAAVSAPRGWRVLVPARAPPFFFLLWLMGAALLLLRLGFGLFLANQLRRRSLPVNPALSVQRLLFSSRHRSAIVILECPLIRVPVTLGAFRPCILLPVEWVEWSAEKLQSVLAHEQTHADRGDCALSLLAEINRALYWFHPLAWWLRGELSGLAEAACDDAAIDRTGDRATYARHLLEVAAAVSPHGRLITAGVSMARESNVETRINAILDFARPLSRRLTWATSVILVAVIAPLVALAAALQLSNSDSSVNPDTTAMNSETSTNESSGDSPTTVDDVSDPAPERSVKTSKSKSTDPREINGHVFDLDGRPIVGARVVVFRTSLGEFKQVRPASIPIDVSADGETKTDLNGRFSLKEPPSSNRFGTREEFVHDYSVIVASAAGYGLD